MLNLKSLIIIACATLITIITSLLTVGCSNNETKESYVAKQSLEKMGFKIIAYKGKDTDYILTKKLLVSSPYMAQWAVQTVDPRNFLPKPNIASC